MSKLNPQTTKEHIIHIYDKIDNIERNHLFHIEKEIKKLISCVKTVLKFSILKGGSSIRDFKNISGKIGDFQSFFKVYGRENKNCSRISCKGKIKKISISSRSSFYCNTCQK